MQPVQDGMKSRPTKMVDKSAPPALIWESHLPPRTNHLRSSQGTTSLSWVISTRLLQDRAPSLYPCEADGPDRLSFAENLVLSVHPLKSGGDWWYGAMEIRLLPQNLNRSIVVFPKN